MYRFWLFKFCFFNDTVSSIRRMAIKQKSKLSQSDRRKNLNFVAGLDYYRNRKINHVTPILRVIPSIKKTSLYTVI